MLLTTATVLLLLLWTLHLSEGANITGVRFGSIQTNGRSGVLEVQIDDTTWGVVCDDGWLDNKANAIVACRSLGFTNGGEAELTGKYGDGTGDFLLDDANCAADMTSLAQCQSAQGGDCKKPGDKVVGIDCNQVSGAGVTTFKPLATTTPKSGVISDNCEDNPTVRLFGKVGIDGMGLVEVQNPNDRNQWGLVCDDGWNAQAAKVVCAQLCFPTNYTAKPGIPSEHKVTHTSPNIILDDVRCTGAEATLQDCPSNDFDANNNCDASKGEFAGVQCVEAEFQPPSPPHPDLVCGKGVLQANFYRSRDSNLEEKHLSVLDDPKCPDVKKSTSTQFVSIIIPVNKCGTNVSRNGTHILYNNEIKYASTLNEGPITRFNTYRVGIECAMPVDKVVTQRVQAVTQAVTEKSDGVIVAKMQIFRGDSFDTAVTENPVRIPLGEYLFLAVVMEDYDPGLKIVVTDCVSTPNGNTSNTRLTKVLFKDKCIEELTLSAYPISNFMFGFRFRPFKFVNFPLLYIQCNAIICLEKDVTKECDRSCDNSKPTSSTGRRKKRSTNQRKSLVSPAIILYTPGDPDRGSESGNTIEKSKNEDEVKIVIEDKATTDVKTPMSQQQTSANIQIVEKTTTAFRIQRETPPVTAAPSKENGDSETYVDNDSKDEKGDLFSQKDGNIACQPAMSSFVFYIALVTSSMLLLS